MKCPICKTPDSKVIDSRASADGFVIRRRRECDKCRSRFTSYERVERVPWKVIKKDGRREDYDREKLLKGIVVACEKRPISMTRLEELVDSIEATLEESYKQEISSQEIGELVMENLHTLDEVAYVRFASVYRQFKDVNQFLNEVNKMIRKQP